MLACTATCSSSELSDAALASKIESILNTRCRDLDLDNYARFYVRHASGSIEGVYYFTNEGHEPIVGESGEFYWVPPDELPQVYGYGSLGITYYPSTETLFTDACGFYP